MKLRPDVSALLYRLPEDLRPLVRKEIKGKAPGDQITHIWAYHGGKVGPDTDVAAYLADAKKQQAAAEHGHRGGVKTARKRRMGLLPAVDPAGKTWKPDFKSPLDRAIYPKYGRVPTYFKPLIPAMSNAVRGTVLLICSLADHKGRFKLPRASHAKWIEASESVAYRALGDLADAGLVRVTIPGDRNQATVWSLAPVAEVDLAKAARALRDGVRERAADIARRLDGVPVPEQQDGVPVPARSLREKLERSLS